MNIINILVRISILILVLGLATAIAYMFGWINSGLSKFLGFDLAVAFVIVLFIWAHWSAAKGEE